MTGYSDWTTALCDLLKYGLSDATSASPSENTVFNSVLPSAIQYAEGRIYRDLDFLGTRKTDAPATTTSGNRSVTIPSTLIVVESVNLITPASYTPGQSGSTRVPLIRLPLAQFDRIFASIASATPAVGTSCYALYEEQVTTSSAAIRIGPTPDATYYVEFNGTFRPAALSASNTDTFLTTYLPDLFLAASMVYLTGFQRDFGAQSDDPKMAQSWEQQYGALKATAEIEEARKKALSQGEQPPSRI